MIAVSVIIPVYNRADLIGRCIESVQKQTLQDIEIIVVNDGSTDNTEDVIRAIGDGRIKIITQENMGQGFARNAGIERAFGRYIAFVDSDDTVEPDMLKTMYDRAEEDSADIVQCNLTDIYPDGHRTIQLEGSDMTVTISDSADYCDRYFTPCRHSYEVCNKLFNREFLLESGVKFRDTKKYFSEDLLFNLELLPYLEKVSFISTPYYNYYQSEKSHLRSDYKKRLDASLVLFADYMKTADEKMKSAASCTAAMIILYNAGFCEDLSILNHKNIKQYIRTSLKRKCTVKHRIFLTAMSIMPFCIRKKLVKMYSGRWER